MEKLIKTKKEGYLYEYAGINNSIVNSKSLKTLPANRSVQLEFRLSEEEEFEKSIDDQNLKHYNRFYVVVYEFDAQSKMISKIALTLPDQQNMRLIEVADLTHLIEESTSRITLDELDVVKNDKVPASTFVDDNQLFGYEIAAEDQKDSN
ncbi:hypothetical protein TP70_08550 [Staphylococcus microti]|uniref:Uncharacterized protein n=1 Tax=Staphylococcus microti TaxID=569857 RepID=A0A0D6XNL6_9STAP|nr:hypothetical protein [Staphylococcus microti]KIX90272.1 hypothetical protein TP70_08550 [Staphylococcus microti]PNZ82521.1 hypothetical protein CD132_04310 [Staphylococcus microti]SUM57281.1 Uncharacterised protein [Staphylococcus microti]